MARRPQTLEDIRKSLDKIREQSVQPKVAETEAAVGTMDNNFATDFLGNLVWGAAETFVVPVV